jgi:uncharacterized damage-inducible protein DinB
MNKASMLSARFEEVIFNGKWVANTNFSNELQHVDLKMATLKFNSLNTIAAIAQHIHYYINGLCGFFKTGNLSIKDNFSFDFNEINSEKEWQFFLKNFWNDAKEFSSLVEQMSDEKLDEIFVDKNYGTYQRNIEAMIEHSYYHLGQIALIVRLCKNQF